MNFAEFALRILTMSKSLKAKAGPTAMEKSIFCTFPSKNFSIFCIAVGTAFAFSDFDMVGGLGCAFDVCCVTLSFLASQSLLVLNC